jgi:hypothetical protein
MAKLTRLFVDAATENIDAIPRRLRELGVRYDPAREQERDHAGCAREEVVETVNGLAFEEPLEARGRCPCEER